MSELIEELGAGEQVERAAEEVDSTIGLHGQWRGGGHLDGENVERRTLNVER
jgi:hypothetical protein